MTDSIWEAIANTPWWVFVLFIFLVRIGLLARKPHIISMKQLLILPIMFFALSLVAIFNLKFQTINLLLWAGAILFGIVLGWLHFRLLKISAIKEKAMLYVPGSWNVLIIILTLFALKYYYNYEIALNSQMLNNPKIIMVLMLSYGLFTGLFIGRITYAFRCLRTGPYLSLEQAQQ